MEKAELKKIKGMSTDVLEQMLLEEEAKMKEATTTKGEAEKLKKDLEGKQAQEKIAERIKELKEAELTLAATKKEELEKAKTAVKNKTEKEIQEKIQKEAEKIKVPEYKDKIGTVITYKNEKGEWVAETDWVVDSIQDPEDIDKNMVRLTRGLGDEETSRKVSLEDLRTFDKNIEDKLADTKYKISTIKQPEVIVDSEKEEEKKKSPTKPTLKEVQERREARYSASEKDILDKQEKAEEALEKIRTDFAPLYQEAKKKNSLWGKMKRFSGKDAFSKEHNDASDKYASSIEGYKKILESKVEERIREGKVKPENVGALLARYRSLVIFPALVSSENEKLQAIERENNSQIQKAWNWYTGLNPWARRGIAFAASTGVIAGLGAIGVGGGIAGVGAMGVRAARTALSGVTGTGFTMLVREFGKTKVGQRIDDTYSGLFFNEKKAEAAEKDLRESFRAASLTVAEMQKNFGKIQSKERTGKDLQVVGKAALFMGASLGISTGIGIGFEKSGLYDRVGMSGHQQEVKAKAEIIEEPVKSKSWFDKLKFWEKEYKNPAEILKEHGQGQAATEKILFRPAGEYPKVGMEPGGLSPEQIDSQDKYGFDKGFTDIKQVPRIDPEKYQEWLKTHPNGFEADYQKDQLASEASSPTTPESQATPEDAKIAELAKEGLSGHEIKTQMHLVLGENGVSQYGQHALQAIALDGMALPDSGPEPSDIDESINIANNMDRLGHGHDVAGFKAADYKDVFKVDWKTGQIDIMKPEEFNELRSELIKHAGAIDLKEVEKFSQLQSEETILKIVHADGMHEVVDADGNTIETGVEGHPDVTAEEIHDMHESRSAIPEKNGASPETESTKSENLATGGPRDQEVIAKMPTVNDKYLSQTSTGTPKNPPSQIFDQPLTTGNAVPLNAAAQQLESLINAGKNIPPVSAMNTESINAMKDIIHSNSLSASEVHALVESKSIPFTALPEADQARVLDLAIKGEIEAFHNKITTQSTADDWERLLKTNIKTAIEDPKATDAIGISSAQNPDGESSLMGMIKSAFGGKQGLLDYSTQRPSYTLLDALRMIEEKKLNPSATLH